jgi:hypothetical protein
MPSTTLSRDIPFLRISHLKWTSDGELCAEDRSLLLQRLAQIDPCLAQSLRQ